MILWSPVAFELGTVLAILVWQLVSIRREIRQDKEALERGEPNETPLPPERPTRRR